MLRIPAQFREAICSLTAELIEGSNAGDESAAVLEQARTKLLLAHLPKGCSTPLEMRTRLDLWRTGAFLELLRRIEGQQRPAAGRSGAGRPRGERARAMAKSGAYRKAVQSLLTASAELTPAEQQRWASELLPDTESAAPNPVRAAADTQELPRPRDGVHFARLSGPGPSGMRPEHLRDMLGCNRRRTVNRLIRALRATEVLAAAGALPACWRWMLGSRLVFIDKKHGRKPRPIRVGEVWRRTVAKHMLHQHNAEVRQRMIAAQQYGVAIPGGAESLIHARRLLEDCLRLDPATGVWAVIDVDFVNAFPRFEWGAVDAAMAAQLPELAAWTRWCHDDVADIDLPSGDVHRARRGAEQGDPHGSLQCGVVLANVVHSTSSVRQGVFLFGIVMTDKPFVGPPTSIYFLECLEAEAEKVGATRGDGPDVKSHVRLVGHPGALSAFVDEGWVTERVSRTCQVDAPNADCDVLGAVVGSAPAANLQFCERIAKHRELHSALAEVNEPATELTLGRACADVCRSVHLFAHGVSEDALKEHDEELNSFVCRALGGDVRAGPLDQAALSVSQGWLGFRRAVGLALPAFISSRVEARPYVEHIFASMASAGVEVPGALAYYDRQTEFKTQLSSDRASLAAERLGRAPKLEPLWLGDPLPCCGHARRGRFSLFRLIHGQCHVLVCTVC